MEMGDPGLKMIDLGRSMLLFSTLSEGGPKPVSALSGAGVLAFEQVSALSGAGVRTFGLPGRQNLVKAAAQPPNMSQHSRF